MADFRTMFLTGNAGTGKTYTVRKNIEKDPKKAKLCATTGIAAVNLSQGGPSGEVVTINSLLKYFDEDSLMENFASGKLRRNLKLLAGNYRNLAIDEVSMLSANSLDIIFEALVDINNLKEVQDKGGLGIWLVGDVLQLPPVKGKFIFHARCWNDNFGQEIKKLTKCHRQSNLDFIEALNCARSGDGEKCAEILTDIGVKFGELDRIGFDGTTIVATNKEVENINGAHLMRLRNEGRKDITFPNKRWGVQRSEWKNIPYELEITEGAYVMILSNDTPNFTYANGLCGNVIGANVGQGVTDVTLIKNGVPVTVKRVNRRVFSKTTPEGRTEPDYMNRTQYKEYMKSGSSTDESYDAYLMLKTIEDRKQYPPDTPYFDYVEGKWVMGAINYMPLRLGYASTVHKCISEDTILFDCKGTPFKIKDVAKGTVLNNMAKVIGVSKSEKKGLCIKTYHGLEIVCSKEHKFPINVNELVEAKDLVIGDKLKVECNFANGDKFDSDIAWLLGALVGNGNYTDRKEGNVHFSTNDEELLSKVSDLVHSKLKVHFGYRSDNEGGFFTSKSVRTKLVEWGLDYVLAASKSIPYVIWGDKLAMAKFVQGLMDCDGHIGKSGVVLTSASKQLLKEVQLMLLQLGIVSKVQEYPGVKKPYYQLRINANMLDRYKDLVGFSIETKCDKLASCKPNRVITKWDGYDRIVSITEVVDNVPMVDIELDSDDRLFSANGIVTHNCQGLTLDRIQIDYKHNFFGNPSMSYVALSRAKDETGLVIGGSPTLLAARTNISDEVLDWI